MSVSVSAATTLMLQINLGLQLILEWFAWYTKKFKSNKSERYRWRHCRHIADTQCKLALTHTQPCHSGNWNRQTLRSIHTVRQRQRLFCRNKVKVFILCGSSCYTITGCHCCSCTNRFQTHLLVAPLPQPQQCEHAHRIQYNTLLRPKKRCHCPPCERTFNHAFALRETDVTFERILTGYLLYYDILSGVNNRRKFRFHVRFPSVWTCPKPDWWLAAWGGGEYIAT